MERKKTLTMNWEGLNDEDDCFFETFDRLSSAVPLDLASSGSDDDEDYDDSRISFASAASSVHSNEYRDFSATGAMSPDYDIWMAAPGSIKERRKRLLQGMGLSSDKELIKIASSVSIKRAISSVRERDRIVDNSPSDDAESRNKQQVLHSPLPVMIVRSRSDSDIESFLVEKARKEELLGKVSKQRLTRTSSMIIVPHARVYPYQDSERISPNQAKLSRSMSHNGALTSILSTSGFGAFFLIKSLDTGKEFIVNGYDEDGMWSKLSDLETGKQLTMEEFEKCVGHSPVVKELMRRENVSRMNDVDVGCDRKFLSANSYLSKSIRLSKRRAATLVKSIKEVAHSMSSKGEKEKENQILPLQSEQKTNKNSSSEWIKVRQTGKSYKDLSALHLCQEIQAHQGSIWTIKFSLDGRFLASAGEDKIIHVWEVQECEVMSLSAGNLTPLHPSLCGSPERPALAEMTPMSSERKKRGKGTSGSKSQGIPEYVHPPETVFQFSETPVSSFTGHLDDVLDLSWSRSQLLLSSSMDKTVRLWDMESQSCLKMFAHNDYVTCIQFNPMDDNYFISGSLDAKVRIWSIPDRQVVDWSDLHEMVTAACYTPDGQSALIGSHKGSCRTYNAEDCKLEQQDTIDVQNKKKSQAKKITGFQFSPVNPSEVLVTSADSRIRILNGSDVINKFRGLRNTSSQIAASFSLDGKYIVSASEDSHVYIWKREEQRSSNTARSKSIITTSSHEQFQCRDVSVAIPWPGTPRGDPPPIQVHSKRPSKRSSSSQILPTNESPRKEDNTACSKRQLPPLPKKKNRDSIDTAAIHPEEELAEISRSDSGIVDSFRSNGHSSMRFGNSPSISANANPSSSWSSSWSWFDNGSNHPSVQATAWGLVIVTATLSGEIRAYQNFGLPRRISRQANLFMNGSALVNR